MHRLQQREVRRTVPLPDNVNWTVGKHFFTDHFSS